MADGLSDLYQDLLTGSYDCVDRIILNACFHMGHSSGGFHVWWQALTGSDDTLDNTHLMRLSGRFSRRLRGYAKAHDIPIIDCSVGERKHDIADEYLAKTGPLLQNLPEFPEPTCSRRDSDIALSLCLRAFHALP